MVALRTDPADWGVVRFADIANKPTPADSSAAQTAVPKASRNDEAGETPVVPAIVCAACAARGEYNWAERKSGASGFAAGLDPGVRPASVSAIWSRRSCQ